LRRSSGNLILLIKPRLWLCFFPDRDRYTTDNGGKCLSCTGVWLPADIYGIAWNQKRFKEYRDAYVEWVQYLDAKAKDPDTPYPQNPAWDKIPKAFDVETDPYLQTSQGQTWFKNTLSNRKTSFKRNRDLCYIVMAAIYAINIIDATVYAHFYDFEIDDNLSFNLQPTSSYSPVSGGSIGLTLTFNF